MIDILFTTLFLRQGAAWLNQILSWATQRLPFLYITTDSAYSIQYNMNMLHTYMQERYLSLSVP